MGEEQGFAQMTRTGWSLVGGLIMGVGFLMPMILAKAGTMSDPKPASSAAELSTIRGVVKATAQATLASQVQGRISQLPFKEGQRFKKGALLVALDFQSMKRNWRAPRRSIAARRKPMRTIVVSPHIMPWVNSNSRSLRPT